MQGLRRPVRNSYSTELVVKHHSSTLQFILTRLVQLDKSSRFCITQFLNIPIILPYTTIYFSAYVNTDFINISALFIYLCIALNLFIHGCIQRRLIITHILSSSLFSRNAVGLLI